MGEHAICWWVLGRRERKQQLQFGARWESLKASGILTLQAEAGRCYCKQCSRKELSSPQDEQVFGWTWWHPSSPALQGSEWSRAGTTLDVTRSLCKQHLDSPSGSSSRNLQSTEKANMKILSAAMATQKYWAAAAPRGRKKYFPQIKERFFPWHWSIYTVLSTSKFPLQKNQKETNETLSSVCFCKTRPRPHSRRENMVSSSHKLLLSNQMQCMQMVPEDLKTVL